MNEMMNDTNDNVFVVAIDDTIAVYKNEQKKPLLLFAVLLMKRIEIGVIDENMKVKFHSITSDRVDAITETYKRAKEIKSEDMLRAVLLEIVKSNTTYKVDDEVIRKIEDGKCDVVFDVLDLAK